MYGEIINNSLILSVYSFPKKNNPFEISASGLGGDNRDWFTLPPENTLKADKYMKQWFAKDSDSGGIRYCHTIGTTYFFESVQPMA